MCTTLDYAAYADAAVFGREQARIFRTLWIFAGVRSMLSWPDAFITRSIGGVPVLLQNCDGIVRAFENQCAHRQMPIQFEEHGTRRMVCRYHGWVYDETGGVKAIPDEQTLYRFTPERRAGLRLREFAVAEVGNLVFVNLADDPLPLEAQFRPAHVERMRAMSLHFSATCIQTVIPVRYNWKFNFENVVDGNHVAYLHPRTFAPLVRPPATAESAAPSAAPPVIDMPSLRNATLNVDSPYQLKHWPWQEQVEGFESDDKFYDFNIYPNVNFYSPGGKYFIIQQFDPAAPALTHYRLTLMTARETGKIVGLPAILWGYLKSEKSVLDEDIVALERLQASLHPGMRAPQQGDYEAPLLNIAAVYRQLMGDA